MGKQAYNTQNMSSACLRSIERCLALQWASCTMIKPPTSRVMLLKRTEDSESDHLDGSTLLNFSEPSFPVLLE